MVTGDVLYFSKAFRRSGSSEQVLGGYFPVIIIRKAHSPLMKRKKSSFFGHPILCVCVCVDEESSCEGSRWAKRQAQVSLDLCVLSLFFL